MYNDKRRCWTYLDSKTWKSNYDQNEAEYANIFFISVVSNSKEAFLPRHGTTLVKLASVKYVYPNISMSHI